MARGGVRPPRGSPGFRWGAARVRAGCSGGPGAAGGAFPLVSPASGPAPLRRAICVRAILLSTCTPKPARKEGNFALSPNAAPWRSQQLARLCRLCVGPHAAADGAGTGAVKRAFVWRIRCGAAPRPRVRDSSVAPPPKAC